MDELTTIGDYDVRVIERAGAVVRFAATHVVLPRRAIIELVAEDAPRAEAMKLLKRACILEALQHPAVPRVFECGRIEGRPWIAVAHEHEATLQDELAHRGLEMREALTLLEEVAAILSHAHARGVLHGNISAAAIVRAPTLRLQRWENARIDPAGIDGADDVFALATTIATSLARPATVSKELAGLLGRMLAEARKRPTAAQVVTEARAIRDAMGTFDQADVERVIDAVSEALAGDADAPDIVIEYDDQSGDDEDEGYILLERRRVPEKAIVDVGTP